MERLCDLSEVRHETTIIRRQSKELSQPSHVLRNWEIPYGCHKLRIGLQAIGSDDGAKILNFLDKVTLGWLEFKSSCQVASPDKQVRHYSLSLEPCSL